MYRIEEKDGKFMVVKDGEAIKQFDSKEEAVKYLDKLTEYGETKGGSKEF